MYLSIDLGLDNFATIVNSVDGAVEIIDGKHVKSLNLLQQRKLQTPVDLRISIR